LLFTEGTAPKKSTASAAPSSPNILRCKQSQCRRLRVCLEENFLCWRSLGPRARNRSLRSWHQGVLQYGTWASLFGWLLRLAVVFSRKNSPSWLPECLSWLIQ